MGIVPGAEWATKRWGEGKYAELAGRLAREGRPWWCLGGPGERDLARRIAAGCGVPLLDTTGNSIAEALALLARCDLVVGGDTGLVHCARALGRPALLIFGPTDPARHLFLADERSVRIELDCSRRAMITVPERCPLGHHRCMTDLEVDEVERQARALLSAGEKRRAESKGTA